MRKLRLNKSHRAVLKAHADKFINKLPLDPEASKEYKEACLRRDTVFQALAESAKTAIAAHFPASDLDVLRRYDCLEKQDNVRLVVLDKPELVFQVRFYDYHARRRDECQLTWEERHERDKQERIVENAASVWLPFSRSSHGKLIPCSEDVYKMAKDLKLAVREEEAAEARLREKQSSLRASLNTLICQAKTYEDIAAVWPQAADVREDLGATAQAVSVLSEDAINEIRKASQMLAAPVKHKALPAPTAPVAPSTGVAVAETIN